MEKRRKEETHRQGHAECSCDRWGSGELENGEKTVLDSRHWTLLENEMAKRDAVIAGGIIIIIIIIKKHEVDRDGDRDGDWDGDENQSPGKYAGGGSYAG